MYTTDDCTAIKRTTTQDNARKKQKDVCSNISQKE